MKAIITSGLPGSGKSTIAKKICQNHSGEFAIHSTDNFFVKNGEYKFDETLLAEHHQNNRDAFEQSLKQKIPLVICANTNLQQQHIEQYQNLAFKYGYQVEVIKVGLIRDKNFIELCTKRNIHLVTSEIIETAIKASDL